MIAVGEARDAGHADLLGAIRELYETIDPMPPGLPGRVQLSLRSSAKLKSSAGLRSSAKLKSSAELRFPADLDAEIARLVSGAPEAALAARGAEESRIVTFDSDSLTIMIRVEANPDGTARVDGWLAPPQPRPVEVKTAVGSITVTADETGRFAVESVPRGSARLVVRPAGAPDGHDGARAGSSLVITPAMALLAGER